MRRHWSGWETGTMHGVLGLPRECKHLFNWGGKKASAVIVDDYFDVGQEDLMADEIRRLSGRTHCQDDFQYENQELGLEQALDFIDDAIVFEDIEDFFARSGGVFEEVGFPIILKVKGDMHKIFPSGEVSRLLDDYEYEIVCLDGITMLEFFKKGGD